MILRSILLLGVGAAFACAAPALAAGTTAPAKTETAAAQPQAVAALESETPKADAPAVKKPTAKGQEEVAKAKAKKKAVVAEEAKPEKPRGLFAALFGGDIKDEAKAKEKKIAKAAPAKPIVKVKAKRCAAGRAGAGRDLSITGNTGELRSEKQVKPALFASLFGGSRRRRHAARNPGARLRP